MNVSRIRVHGTKRKSLGMARIYMGEVTAFLPRWVDLCVRLKGSRV